MPAPLPLNEEQEKLLEPLPTKKRQFILAMKDTFGNVAQSCDIIGITRRTYYNWLRDDILFAHACAEIDFKERALDYVENKLFKKIEEGDVASIIFYLKTQGRSRGYDERKAKQPGLDLDKEPQWFDDQKQLPEGGFEDAIIVTDIKSNPNDQNK